MNRSAWPPEAVASRLIEEDITAVANTPKDGEQVEPASE